MSARSLRSLALLLALVLTAAGCVPVVSPAASSPVVSTPASTAPSAAPPTALPPTAVPPTPSDAAAPTNSMKALRLLAPDLTQPIESPLDVRWEALAEAATYRVVIVDMGTSELVFQQDVAATSLTAQPALKPAHGYSLSIAGLDAQGEQVAFVNAQFSAAGTAIAPQDEPIQSLPSACFREGLLTYVDRDARLCLPYPHGFAFAGAAGSYAAGSQAKAELRGPAVGGGPEPLFARLSLDFQPYAGVDLPQFVDEMIKRDVPAGLAAKVERQQTMWGGHAAEVLEPWPGQLSARVVVVDAAPDGFNILTFWPSFKDTPAEQLSAGAVEVRKDVEALHEMVADGFAKLPPPGVPISPDTRIDLPKSCLVAGRPLYVDSAAGYCFAVTPEVMARRNADGAVGFYGPALDDSVAPLRVEFGLTVSDAKDATLDEAVETLTAEFGQLPQPVDRQEVTVAGEPAVRLDGTPGRPTGIAVLMLHDGRLFQFRFTPDLSFEKSRDATIAPVDLVLGSFGFLPAPTATAAQPAAAVKLLRPSDPYGGVSFSYPESLATGTRGETAAAAGGTGAPWWGVWPRHVEVGLLGYVLPETDQAPRVAVYPVAEFAALSEQAKDQVIALQNLLAAKPQDLSGQLPFLPLMNGVQQMHARVKYQSFAGGAGVSYLTQYSQGIVPVNSAGLFYTFQGLTADGKYYVSAVLPVSNATLPATADAMPKDRFDALAADFQGYLKDMTATLSSAAGSDFTPALSDLDALVQSIQVVPVK